jgi:hypothetical protein
MRGRPGTFSGGLTALLLLAVPVLLVGPAAALAQAGSGIVPGLVTDDEQACISVANLTQFNWPITIQRTGRARSTVGVKPREVMRYCAPDRLKPGEHIIVTLRSSWVPLGECELRNRGTMEISRVPDKDSDSGERTIVKCYGAR